MKVKIKKLVPEAIIPKYQTSGAAGFDLVSVESFVGISPGKMKTIKTGLVFEIPVGYEMQVRPRSGLAHKHQLTVLNSPGTIDSDYRGEVMVMLQNHSTDRVTIRLGDRIAQGVICPVMQVYFEEVEELSQTERGEGGFGSTGK